MLAALLFIAGLSAIGGGGDAQLLCFSATWCGPCQKMKPVVQQLSRDGYPIKQLDVDEHKELARQFKVNSVPSFVLVNRHGQVIDRIDQATTHKTLTEMLTYYRIEPKDITVRGQNPIAVPVVRPVERPGAYGGAGVAGRAASGPANLAPIANAGTRPDYDGSSAGVKQPVGSRTPSQLATQPYAQPNTEPVGNPTSHQQRSPEAVAMLTSVRGGGYANQATNAASVTEQAMASTVRLKVEDEEGHSFGTGTVIDVHGQEALVLTCGHIFRPSDGKGRILIDRFDSPTAEPTIGSLISYDMDLDIGLVSMKLTRPVQVARLAPITYQANANDPIFSIGCDRGAPPTVMQGRVNQIDRYLGPPNITASGQPVDGRSGGGLFSDRGELIGVCSAADPELDEGLYAALPRVYYELDRNGLTFVYDEADGSQPIAEVATASHDLDGLGPNHAAAQQHQAATEFPMTTHAAESQELVCVLRGESNGDNKVIVIKNPSRDLIERLSSEAAMSQ